MTEIIHNIAGFPKNPDLRHLASVIEDRIKNKKLEEKKFSRELLDIEFFKIKSKPRTVDVVPVSDTVPATCSTCIKPKENPSSNFYVNVLDAKQFHSLRNGKESFTSKLMLIRCQPCVDCTTDITRNKDLITYVQEEKRNCRDGKQKHNGQIITSAMLNVWIKNAISTFTYQFSSLAFKLIGYCWYLLSERFMQRFIVSSLEVRNLRETQDSHVPVVYVLRKRSNWDWFFVLFVLFFCGLKPPVVMIEESSKFAWSWLVRKCGVIFIKPSTNNYRSKKRSMYEEIKLAFIEENLRSCNHIMFCLDFENGSDGEFFMDCIIDGMKRNAIADVTIVPTALYYERTMVPAERKMSAEIKHPWSKLGDILRRRFDSFGLTKITFGQPFSLTGMAMSVGTKEEIAPYDVTQMQYDPTTKLLLKKILDHMAYDFCRSEIVMSSNVVCFLLLKKFRRGIKLKDLAIEVHDFCTRLNEKRIRLGFDGDSKHVVNHALHLLGNRFITIDTSNEMTVKPILELPQVLDISAYASFAFRHFLMDAVIMKSVSQLIYGDLDEMMKETDKVYSFYENEMLEKAETFCRLLQYEFQFEKPCRSLNNELNDVFFKLVTHGYFTKIEKMLTEEEQWGHRVAKMFDESDEDSDLDEYPVRINRGDEYLVNHKSNECVVKDFMFYTNCLQSIMDTYLVNCDCLKILVGTQMMDCEYYAKVMQKMKVMLAEEQLKYAESISIDTLKNSMKSYQYLGIVESFQVNDVQIYYLSADYDDVNKLDIWAEKIKYL